MLLLPVILTLIVGTGQGTYSLTDNQGLYQNLSVSSDGVQQKSEPIGRNILDSSVASKNQLREGKSIATNIIAQTSSLKQSSRYLRVNSTTSPSRQTSQRWWPPTSASNVTRTVKFTTRHIFLESTGPRNYTIL